MRPTRGIVAGATTWVLSATLATALAWGALSLYASIADFNEAEMSRRWTVRVYSEGRAVREFIAVKAGGGWRDAATGGNVSFGGTYTADEIMPRR